MPEYPETVTYPLISFIKHLQWVSTRLGTGERSDKNPDLLLGADRMATVTRQSHRLSGKAAHETGGEDEFARCRGEEGTGRGWAFLAGGRAVPRW